MSLEGTYVRLYCVDGYTLGVAATRALVGLCVHSAEQPVVLFDHVTGERVRVIGGEVLMRAILSAMCFLPVRFYQDIVYR